VRICCQLLLLLLLLPMALLLFTLKTGLLRASMTESAGVPSTAKACTQSYYNEFKSGVSEAQWCLPHATHANASCSAHVDLKVSMLWQTKSMPMVCVEAMSSSLCESQQIR
jgi:hypothetical protein